MQGAKMAMSFSIRDFFYCLGFLSRIPVANDVFDRREKDALSKHVTYFPLVGLAVATPAIAATIIAALLDLPASVAAILIVIVEIITIGALHEDGFADCADGFYGGHTIERRLEIMKDSTIGTYGALALLLSIALRIACLAALWDALSLTSFICVLFAVHAASRSVMAYFWQILPPARTNGLAANAGVPNKDDATMTLGLGLALFAILVWFTISFSTIILAGAISAGLFFTFLECTKHKIGGHTGDTLGAIQQITTLGLLLGLVATL